MLTIKEIEYLLALKKNNSFTAAAKELYITQPSLSTAIKKIEERYNTQLVLRHPNGKIAFTSTAEKIFPLAEKILKYQNQIISILTDEVNTSLSDLDFKINIYINKYLTDSFYDPIVTQADINNINISNISFIELDEKVDYDAILLENDNSVILDIFPLIEENINVDLDDIILDTSQCFVAASNITSRIDLSHNTITLKELSGVPIIRVKSGFAFDSYWNNRLKESPIQFEKCIIPTLSSCFVALENDLAISITLKFNKILKRINDNLIYIPLAETVPFAIKLRYRKNIDNKTLHILHILLKQFI